MPRNARVDVFQYMTGVETEEPAFSPDHRSPEYRKAMEQELRGVISKAERDEDWPKALKTLEVLIRWYYYWDRTGPELGALYQWAVQLLQSLVNEQTENILEYRRRGKVMEEAREIGYRAGNIHFIEQYEHFIEQYR